MPAAIITAAIIIAAHVRRLEFGGYTHPCSDVLFFSFAAKMCCVNGFVHKQLTKITRG